MSQKESHYVQVILQAEKYTQGPTEWSCSLCGTHLLLAKARSGSEPESQEFLICLTLLPGLLPLVSVGDQVGLGSSQTYSG